MTCMGIPTAIPLISIERRLLSRAGANMHLLGGDNLGLENQDDA